MNTPFHLPLALLGLGSTELVVILVILLVLFGGSKLPSLARGLGQSIKEFKKASKEGDDEARNDPPATKVVQPTAATPATKPGNEQ